MTTSINVQDLLYKLETVIAEEFPDDPEFIEEGVTIAEDILFGTDDVAGVASTSEITQDDYARFAGSICEDADTAEFHYGSAVNDDLFFEVRDFLDEILQDEFHEYNSSTFTLWGECPNPNVLQSLTTAPLFIGSGTVDLFTGYPVVATAKPEEKQTKQTLNRDPPSSQTESSFDPFYPYPYETLRTTTRSSSRMSGQLYCYELSKYIQPGGADLVVIGAGFSCEYNYNPDRSNPVIQIGFDGKIVTPDVYRYYPKIPIPPKTPTPTATSNMPVTNSQQYSTVIPQKSPLQTSKPKSLDDLYRMYDEGASDEEIQNMLLYKGNVPWDVDDPDGINEE